jgi:hypothetical protein
VSSHDQLSGVGADDHHTRPTGTQSESIPGGYKTPQVTGSVGFGTPSNTVDDDTGTDTVSTGNGDYVQIAAEDGFTGVRHYSGYNSGSAGYSFEIQTTSGTTLASYQTEGQAYVEVSLGGLYTEVRVVLADSQGNIAELDVDQPILANHSHSL